MIGSIIDRWQARYAERLLTQAKSEVGHPRPRMTVRLAIGWTLSFLFLATPFIVIAAGIVLIAVTFLRIGPIIVGLILIGFGLTLLPPRSRNTLATYRRSDLPAFFSLLDRIAETLGTTAPDGVHVDSEVNAYMGQFQTRRFGGKQEWILGLGLPLWMALNNQERIALLAHEMAHKVNDDPMRQGVFFRAASVLENWQDTFELDADDVYSGGLVQDFAGMLVGFLQRILLGFSFFESQRAEYRADARAARIAGASPVIGLLEKIVYSDLARRSVVELYPYEHDRGGRIFDHMGAAVANADPDTAARLLAEAAREKRRVDDSHPPTAMRIEFVESLAQGPDKVVDAGTIDFEAIDQQLGSIKHALGEKLMGDLFEAEVNK